MVRGSGVLGRSSCPKLNLDPTCAVLYKLIYMMTGMTCEVCSLRAGPETNPENQGGLRIA